MLVAVVMLFVIGAMAALSIDVVTLYTARSEAQLAADSAALAGARVLANSGMTSAPGTATTQWATAVPLATAVAQQVAASNPVGGRKLSSAGSMSGRGNLRQHQRIGPQFRCESPRDRAGAAQRSADFFCPHLGTHDDYGQSVGDSRGLQPFQCPGNIG